MFQKKYADVFKGDARWQASITDSETHDWPAPTYIQNPPHFVGMVAGQGRDPVTSTAPACWRCWAT